MNRPAHATGIDWWRPAPAALENDRAQYGSRVAFGCLVAFSVILLLAPQSLLPALKVIRIALLTAGFGIVVHVCDATVHRRPLVAATPELVLALGLLAWSIFTIPFSMWPGGSIAVVSDQYVKAVVFFWMIGAMVTTRDRLRRLSWALALCAIPLALMAVQHYLAGDFLRTGVANLKRIEGYTGLSGNPNDLALTLNLLIPIGGALFLTSKGVARFGAAMVLLAGIPAVILTFSRAGFITLGAVLFLALVFLARRRAPVTAGVIVIVAVAAVPFLPDGYMDRIRTITNIEADPTGSAQGRWADFQNAATIVVENPVLGVGVGQDILALNEVRGKLTWRSVHNAYLEYAVDLGIPGITMFLLLLGSTFVTIHKVKKGAGRDPALRDVTIFASGVEIALFAFAIAAMFHPIAYQFYFFCVGGLAMAVRNAYRADVRTLRAAAARAAAR
jgi:O-antigen ligase